MKPVKIAITGGHLTPAQAFIEHVQTQQESGKITDPISFIFIGREYSKSDKQQKAREAIEIGKLGVPFVNLEVPKFVKKNVGSLLLDTAMYPLALLKAIGIIVRYQPTVLVSFGSYLAVPVAIACWILGIPIVTHEQTVVGGSANKVIAKLATKVALAFPQSKKYFPGKKSKVTGNPLRSRLLQKNPPQPSWFKQPLSKPLLFVAGGNQGSYFVNTLIANILPQLTRKYLIIHACGSSTTQLNYKEDLQAAKQKLSPNQRSSYFIREWITQEELAWVLKHATLAITRSGANTVQELVLANLPAIFIPLPFAKNDEQLRNAQMVAKTGGAVLLTQNTLTPNLLLDTINKSAASAKKMSAALSSFAIPKDGAARLFELVTTVYRQK